jgi:hypothetical protein
MLRPLPDGRLGLDRVVIWSDPESRAAGAALTIGLVAVSLWLSRRLAASPGSAGAFVGVAAIPAWVGWAGSASAGLMVGLGLAAGLSDAPPDRQLPAVVMIMLGGLVGCLANPDRLWSLRVTWRAEGLEGASRTFASILRGPREPIAWRELTRLGCLDGGLWFVEAFDGRRVYWSDLHGARAILLSAIRLRRPDLFGSPSGTRSRAGRPSNED